MKNIVKSAFFFAAMLTLAVGCQSKKAETESTAGDTATVVESETLTSGDTTLVVSDTAKIAPADSAK